MIFMVRTMRLPPASSSGRLLASLLAAAWFGGEDCLGRTFWRSIDSSALRGLTNEALNHISTRLRPSRSPDPKLRFHGLGRYDFRSGEVSAVAQC